MKDGDEKIIEQLRDGSISSNHAYESLSRVKALNMNKGKTYRSRLGIVFDILRTIKDSIEDVRISTISRNANLSYDIAIKIVNELIENGILELKKYEIKGKYYEAKTTEKFYLVTQKGNELYGKFLQLYDMLPESMRLK